jgi:bifunctional non-homologous end joining protein LigD
MAGEEEAQLICDDEETLLYLANLATLPIHLWASRLSAVETPDWCVVDLDPKTAPFADVLTLARALHDLCDELELPSYCKTTGSSGLHVMIPLGAQIDHSASVMLAELLAGILHRAHPGISTLERVIEARRGKVYLDCYQNGRGKQLVSPFCVRALPGAPVAMPVEWREVNEKLTSRQYNIKNALARLEKKGDLHAALLTEKPDLARALARAEKKLSGGDLRAAAPPRRPGSFRRRK